MAVYNGDRYLKEAIESVLNQTFTDFEFIIVNDGSTDSSLSIIKSYSDHRIVLINNEENQGLIFSLNRAIKSSKGKYLARMDADDICIADRFRLQYEYLETNPGIGVLGSSYYSFDETSRNLNIAHAGSDRIKTFLLFSATFCHPTLMIRKSILEKNHLLFLEEAKHAEDYDLWTRMALLTNFENLPFPLLNYRQHQSQVSKAYSSVQSENSKIIREKYLTNLNFSFNQENLIVHQRIASNQFITSKVHLLEIEKWLENLIDQNAKKNILNNQLFNSAIVKMWKDCCGNTNLGLWSYLKFHSSSLRKLTEHESFFEWKLLFKCLVRYLK